MKRTLAYNEAAGHGGRTEHMMNIEMISGGKTIAAISTGMTSSGIGIVRISGDEAFGIADKVYKGN